ncbi:putative cystatin-9-like protein CST9LP1 [Echinops telfairi]|uniref:Cystatin-9-like protein CST9LP1 n=1 Tax=Echinops telfairi TaxID=9371 RepID=A0ABM0J859_ECHTE|nr:putative cystatin-9-like protein CST9LP1 [Echinops telfairi]
MPRQPQRWVWPSWVLLLLLGFLPLVTREWQTKEENDLADQSLMALYFPATVEFALYTFNLRSRDTHAYKLVRILSAWREQREAMLTFSMELELGRTRCGKFEEDIENCPFQESLEMLSCFFTIRTQPWRTKFHLLNSTCKDGAPNS